MFGTVGTRVSARKSTRYHFHGTDSPEAFWTAIICGRRETHRVGQAVIDLETESAVEGGFEAEPAQGATPVKLKTPTKKALHTAVHGSVRTYARRSPFHSRFARSTRVRTYFRRYVLRGRGSSCDWSRLCWFVSRVVSVFFLVNASLITFVRARRIVGGRQGVSAATAQRRLRRQPSAPEHAVAQTILAVTGGDLRIPVPVWPLVKDSAGRFWIPLSFHSYWLRRAAANTAQYNEHSSEILSALGQAIAKEAPARERKQERTYVCTYVLMCRRGQGTYVRTYKHGSVRTYVLERALRVECSVST